jgi:branched-chain amino acid transport system ATP-binding protein
MLKLSDLSTGYGKIQVLWNINLEVAAGELVAVIGSNGAGKTTLMKCISGVVPVWEGTIEFKDRNITRWPSRDRVKHGIVMLPEGRQLFYPLSVQDNLLLGALYIEKRLIKQRMQYVFELFPEIARYRNRLAGTLSGGEQQMCALGRALMACPSVLLIDELSLGLAPVIVERLAAKVTEIVKDGVAVVLVEQDVALALELASRAYVIENGQIVLTGPSSEVMVNPAVQQAYLGVSTKN